MDARHCTGIPRPTGLSELVLSVQGGQLGIHFNLGLTVDQILQGPEHGLEMGGTAVYCQRIGILIFFVKQEGAGI